MKRKSKTNLLVGSPFIEFEMGANTQLPPLEGAHLEMAYNVNSWKAKQALYFANTFLISSQVNKTFRKINRPQTATPHPPPSTHPLQGNKPPMSRAKKKYIYIKTLEMNGRSHRVRNSAAEEDAFFNRKKTPDRFSGD
ncbi:hypothetical protein CDAR_475641 [Caerostris darwini]|uniref:Uncharacterized protein n=1 Tax=Caerostris darwini TaxID=1538125 RepID=A0AAV4P8Q0_9ARAC|nr:hypothetical protein CDAR_475641 [Caerostris darwini]